MLKLCVYLIKKVNLLSIYQRFRLAVLFSISECFFPVILTCYLYTNNLGWQYCFRFLKVFSQL